MPNNPANDGNRRLAFGIPTGDLAGSANTAHPYMPANKKKPVAARNPANLESSPNLPPLSVLIHFGQVKRVVSVISNSAEIVSNIHGREFRIS